MIGLHVRTRFHESQLKAKVKQAEFRSLGHAGAAIRLTARRSIRRRKKPSRPGSPPHTQTGRLKRSLRYEVREAEVVVGPVNELAGRIWNLHEFGGLSKRTRRRRRTRKVRMGQYGPVRIRSSGPKRTYHRARLTTTSQVARANRLIEEDEKLRSARRTYPKRPFMGPALDTNRTRLPKFWASSVK